MKASGGGNAGTFLAIKIFGVLILIINVAILIATAMMMSDLPLSRSAYNRVHGLGEVYDDKFVNFDSALLWVGSWMFYLNAVLPAFVGYISDGSVWNIIAFIVGLILFIFNLGYVLILGLAFMLNCNDTDNGTYYNWCNSPVYCCHPQAVSRRRRCPGRSTGDRQPM